MPGMHNPLGLEGIAFVEFASPEPEDLHRRLLDLGFARVARHRMRGIDLYEQNDVCFLLNRDRDSSGARLARTHGASISAIGCWVRDAALAGRIAAQRGADLVAGDLQSMQNTRVVAVRGVGGSLVYLVERTPAESRWEGMGFVPLEPTHERSRKELVAVGRVATVVEHGAVARWKAFYEDVFGFTEERELSLSLSTTALRRSPCALRSPCGTFFVSIRELDSRRRNARRQGAEGARIDKLGLVTRTADVTLSAEREQAAPTGSARRSLDRPRDGVRNVRGPRRRSASVLGGARTTEPR